MRKLAVAAALIGVLCFADVSSAESYISGYVGMAKPHNSDVSASFDPSGILRYNQAVTFGVKAGIGSTKCPLEYS